MFTVAALYKFTPLPDPAALRGPLLEVCSENAVKGTLLLASEGVNGTIAGPRGGVDAVLAQEPELDASLDVRGNVELGVAEAKALEDHPQLVRLRALRETLRLGSQNTVDLVGSIDDHRAHGPMEGSDGWRTRLRAAACCASACAPGLAASARSCSRRSGLATRFP